MIRPQEEGEAAEKPKRNSKLPSETVVLLVLCVLLAAALIIVIRLSLRITNQSVQTLREENEALRKNLSEITWRYQPTCPPPETHNKRCLELEGDWEEHGGKCYYISTCRLTWTESRRLCRDVGGDLVKIDSREEQEILIRKLRENSKTFKYFVWIGLTDSETEGSWFWADGSPLNKSLSFWVNNAPINSKYWDPDGEDCVTLDTKKADGDLQTWNDFPCSFAARFVCEKPPGSAQSSCV